MRSSSRVTCALAAFFAGTAVSAVQAQTRPLVTEEATTAPAGTLVLELGGDFMRDEPNFLTLRERDRWEAPVLRLVWSPAASVEMDVEWVGRVAARGDPDFGNVSDFGDVTLRAKARLIEERSDRPGLAVRFGVTLAETSYGNGLGPNTLRMSAQVLLSKSIGRAAFHANLGLALQDEALRPHEQRDLLHYGLAVTRRLGGRVWVVAEIAGLAGKGAPGTDARSEARAGLRGGVRRLHWDAALRRGLAEADGTWGLTLGLRWTLRGS